MVCPDGAAAVSSVVSSNLREVLLQEQWHGRNDLCHPALIHGVDTVLRNPVTRWFIDAKHRARNSYVNFLRNMDTCCLRN